MEGHPEIKLFYRYGGSFMGTMTETNKWVQAYQSPKLETIVNQSVWMDPETKMADIILPACTSFERNDIAHVFRDTEGTRITPQRLQLQGGRLREEVH